MNLNLVFLLSFSYQYSSPLVQGLTGAPLGLLNLVMKAALALDLTLILAPSCDSNEPKPDFPIIP